MLPAANKESDNESRTSESKTSDPEENAKAAAGKEGKLKYWIVSSGSDYIGYSITVSVNGTAVDSFFGPGKCIDLTRYVRAGENTVSFDCKLLGDKYNKHKGDERSALTLALVSGAHIIPDNFKKSDVVLTYKRNASESEEFNDTEHFSRD